MKFRVYAGLPLLATIFCLGCSNNNNTTASSIGNVYVSTAGDATVQAYGITLSTGALSDDGQGVPTGATPAAMAISPDAGAIVIANRDADNLSVYTVNGDGSLAAASGNPATGKTPVAVAFNPAGTFFFVANQTDSTISVYSVSGTTLTAVAGSPFSTVTSLLDPNTLPSALVVSASGNYLYVANSLTNTVSSFQIGSNGVLTQSTAPPYPVGVNPSGLGITPTGSFLYVANFGDNNVSAFAICDAVTTTCAGATGDGSLTPVVGSPFSAGIGPVAMASDPSGSFLYVVDKTSNQVSQYRISSGTGVITAFSPAAVSTGTTPVAAAVHIGTNVVTATGGTVEYLYVANNGSTSLSIYSFDSTLGPLGIVGSPFPTISGNPTAVVTR
jgi:6-phosphogluconolactonase